jgi:hypothetical protein
MAAMDEDRSFGAGRIAELKYWIDRIGDHDTISEYMTNDMKKRLAELLGHKKAPPVPEDSGE